MKKCSKCNNIKTTIEFYKNKSQENGLSCWCKECNNVNSIRNKERIKSYKKEYSLKNKENIVRYKKEWYNKNRKRMNKISKKYCKNNKEKINRLSKKYYLENKEKLANAKREYRKKNKNKIREYKNKYYKDRCKIDLLFKLTYSFRRRICLAFRQVLNIKKNKRTFEMIGCSPQELKTYIESKFKDGMTWGNYGYYGWHIDHIIPLASAKTEEEMIRLCHYTNLQPLWAEENLRKGSKII